MIFLYCQFVVFFSILIYRVIVFDMPFFSMALRTNPLFNVASGLVNDFEFIFILLMVLEIFKWIPRKFRFLKISFSVFSILLTVSILLSLAILLRYLEHFGMSLQLFHLKMTSSDNGLFALMIVFTSMRAMLILIGAPVLSGIALAIVPRGLKLHSQNHKVKFLIAMICSIVTCHSLTLHFRYKNVHKELRYNPFFALYFHVYLDQGSNDPPPPTRTMLEKVRTTVFLNHPKRDWRHFPQDSQEYLPLSQNRIVAGSSRTEALKKFLREEASRHGPWNVVLLLQESMRAHEIAVFGNDEALYRDLSPNFTKIFSQGIRFTEAYGVGIYTGPGQVASQCSLPSFSHIKIIDRTPLAKFTCISDILKGRGYETAFINTIDNHFDNQLEFYQFHRMDHVIGKEAFKPARKLHQWGSSDLQLIEYIKSAVPKFKQPFYLTALTISNHIPHNLPDDAPDWINRSLPNKLQLLQYVDWVFGNFYQFLSQNFPHTILITVADHGLYDPDLIIDENSHWPDFRRIHRIPITINIPNLPANLQMEVKDLTSNLDITPTLLNLLDLQNVPNQFLGVDAFSRGDLPVPINVYERLFTLDEHHKLVRASEFDDQLFQSLAIYNLLSP